MNDTASPTPRSTYAGLTISLLIPALLITSFSKLFVDNKFLGNILLEIGMWSCTIAILLIVTKWEKLPLSSIGLKRPTAKSIGIGFGCYFALAITVVIVRKIMMAAGIPYSIHNFLTKILSFPSWWRVFIVLTAATVEEVLFRGYPIERLLPIVKSKTVAGLLPLLVFTFGHQFSQQPGNLIIVFITGAFLTVVYLWKRDLTINITLHFIVDFLSVIVLPLVIPQGL